MVKIHPLVWMTIGAIVGGFSAFITYVRKQDGFQIFLFVGIMFFAYGLVMLAIHGITRKKPTKSHDKHPFGSPHQLEDYLATCPYCRARIPSNSLFCSYCGRRLR